MSSLLHSVTKYTPLPKKSARISWLSVLVIMNGYGQELSIRGHEIMTISKTSPGIAAGVSALLLGFAMSAGFARADLHDPLAGKGQVSGKPSIGADAPAAQDPRAPTTMARSAVAGLMKRIENQDTTVEEEAPSCNHD